jgi:hypothetical protein
MSDKKSMLKLMRFWLFGTFVIVWTAITIYIGLFTSGDWWTAIRAGFPIWGICGVLCFVVYYGYKTYQSRRQG